MESIKTTQYFRNEVLRKRPYLKLDWCVKVLNEYVHKEVQPNGRIRFWGFIKELKGTALRVVTLEDGETIHNAFPDRDFKEDKI